MSEAKAAPAQSRTESTEGFNGRTFFAGLICLVAALLSLQSSAMVAIPGTIIGLLALSSVARATVAVNMCLLLSVPYACGSYIGATLDITFFPRPPIGLYERAAVEQTSSLLVAASVSAMLGISAYFQRSLSAATKRLLRNPAGDPSSNLAFKSAVGIALILGIHDLYFVATNLQAVLSSTRHSFRDEFWAASGPFGIVLALTVSATLAVNAARPESRVKALLPLAILWVPTLLAGGRNYLSVAAISVAAVFFIVTTFRQRIILTLALFLGIYGFAIVPTLWSENKLVWLNEWILPNSLYLPLYSRLYDLQGVGVTTFWEQSALLLPSGLRPNTVVTYSQRFEALGFTNVGVGGNPWADFFHEDAASRILAFVTGTLVVFLVAAFGSRISPMVPALTVGIMCFWGRSSFWNTMFIVVYVILLTLVIRIVARLFGDRRA
ncbi:hypothetical protein GM708_10200 [Vibrio cholerae]|nr:hypothetical protein [Vibrio cholerae]